MHQLEKTPVSVVVPVYNSQANLVELVQRLSTVLTPLVPDFEIVLVNDGSRDESWQVICNLAEQFSYVHGISLMRNYGQHNALLCGIRAAQFEVIVTIDDDLQHPPEEVPKLLDKLAEGYDVVYGIPPRMPHSLWRNLLSKNTKWVMARALGIKTIRDINAFRSFKTDLRKAFVDYRSSTLILDALLSWGTTQFTTVKVNHQPRLIGKSNYNSWKLVDQTMFMLTGFSTAPLRLASFIGFGFTLFGVLVFLYVLIQFFLMGSLPGFPFLASVIAIFSGAQLFALGIIGEYLARIFNRSMERPTYAVSQNAGRLAEQEKEKNQSSKHGFLSDPLREEFTTKPLDLD